MRRQAREAVEDYFYTRLGLTPEHAVDTRAPLPPTLEPLPDGMYRALEDLVELVVDGKYADLHELSRESLEVEDLYRRIEDDCPEALVLPPREHYGIETITKSDEPGDQGWGFFLDLWTEDGPARCTSRASWTSPATATSSRSPTSCPDERGGDVAASPLHLELREAHHRDPLLGEQPVTRRVRAARAAACGRARRPAHRRRGCSKSVSSAHLQSGKRPA